MIVQPLIFAICYPLWLSCLPLFFCKLIVFCCWKRFLGQKSLEMHVFKNDNYVALIFGVSMHAFHHYICTLSWCSFPVQVSPARWMLHGLEVFADVIPVRSSLCACVRHIQCPERTAVARSHINTSRARTLCGFQLMLVNRTKQAHNSIALSSLLKRAKSSLKWHWQVKSRGTAN